MGVGGGTWTEDGAIVFAASRHISDGRLLRVSSEGGAAEPLVSSTADDSNPRFPQMLPGGRAILFTGTGANGSWDHGNLVVQLAKDGARRIVLRDAYHGRYVQSGHVVFIRNGTLFAVPFDRDRLEVTGNAVPIIEGLTAGGVTGGAQISASASGGLVYLPGSSVTGVPVSWLERDGKTTPLRAAPAEWFNARFAPDGRRIALQIFDGKTIDIWAYEWARDTMTRVTPADGNKTDPVWTPDGRRLTFAWDAADTSSSNLTLRNRNLYWQSADGPGDPQRLTKSLNHQLPGAWHPNGEKPYLWAEGRFLARGPFDLHPDGERFAIAAPAPAHDARGSII